MRNDSRKVMAELEARYIEETGIKTLRVRHNNILGFFIEVTQLNAKPLLSPPLSERFRHRQTMANAVRFVTPELLETEGQIASASERALNLEQEIFAELAQDIAAAADALGAAAAALAELDVFASLAHLALEQGYVRPVIDDSLAFEIRGGRHPVVQQALAKNGEARLHRERLRSRQGWKRSARWIRAAAGGAHLARDRAEHGRQIDVPAPERADHGHGADGIVRAGAVGSYRRRRPVVLARRRVRRSGARPLDIHGRDGRDGGHPQSGEASGRW